MSIKISDIKKANPCDYGWNNFKQTLKPYQRVTTIKDILKSNGISDCLWVIGNVLKDKKALVKLSRQFADSVKHLNNIYAADAARAAAHAYAAYAADAAHTAYAYAAVDAIAATAERKKQEQMIINYFK